MEDSDGEIWISTVNEGLFRYTPETERLTVYRHDPADDTSIAQDYISAVYESSDGTIWLGTYDKGLCAFSKESGKFTLFRAEGGGISQLSDNSINAIVEDSFGNLWIGTVNHGIDCLDRHTGTVTNFDDSKSDKRLHHIHHLAEYAPGELFVCSHSGASVFGIADGELVPKTDNISFTASHNRSINTSFRDREGNLWLGSLYNGAEFHPVHNNFTYYSTSLSDNPDFGCQVQSICHYRGPLYWIGTSNNGIMLFDSSTGEISPFSTAHDIRTPSFQAHSLLSDNDRLWIAAYQHGVMAIDHRTGRKKSYLSEPLSPRVFTLYRNTFGVIYAGTATGLYRYDSKTDRFELVQNSSRICYITEDHNGLLWVATSEQGIYTYDAKLNRIVCYRSDDDPASLCSNSVMTFAVDNAKRMWIGTDEGLCRYDFIHDRFVRYPDLKLPDSNIKSIIPDGSLLWITTGNGLSSFEPETQTLKNYRYSDGLCNPMFMPNAGTCSSSGKILLGTADGICMFTPRRMFESTNLPPVVITDLLVHGGKMHPQTDGSPLSKPIENTDEISLSHKQRLIGLRFTAPNYLAPQSIRYRFRLDGARNNETWHTLDDEHSTVYYNLDPGHYVFRVQAATDNGTWGGETTLAIRIRPPFMLSTAASTIYAVILGLAIFIVVRQLQKRNRRKYAESIRLMESRREHEHYRAQVNLLTTLSHEIRTPLSLIIGPLEYIMSNHAAEDKFGEYLRIIKNSTDRLQELINQLLDFRQAKSSDQQTVTRFADCDITGLLDTQAELFRFPASKKGISIRVERPDGLTIVSDRETLTKVLGNL
ncbi:MAG: hybrid sensor histidine kinase/response regulator, partial [Alistipes sp.]|nr:hybrid sensor histidine kinase/response regulator [Alistipes sp.]